MGTYEAWARYNCPKFCGYCGANSRATTPSSVIVVSGQPGQGTSGSGQGQLTVGGEAPGWTCFVERKGDKLQCSDPTTGEQRRMPSLRSLQFSPLTGWVLGGTQGMIQQRSSSSLLLREDIVSSSGVGRDVHFLTLCSQCFLCRPRLRPPFKVF